MGRLDVYDLPGPVDMIGCPWAVGWFRLRDCKERTYSFIGRAPAIGLSKRTSNWDETVWLGVAKEIDCDSFSSFDFFFVSRIEVH